MNEDASLALRSALRELDIAPEGFNDMKIENFKRFKSVWPKEFPPIEPNTPMWWLIDIIAQAITEIQLEPLKTIKNDVVSDVVAKEIHSESMQKEIRFYIEKMVESKIEEYLKKNQEKEVLLNKAFIEGLESI
jgi:hypothetical protein